MSAATKRNLMRVQRIDTLGQQYAFYIKPSIITTVEPCTDGSCRVGTARETFLVAESAHALVERINYGRVRAGTEGEK